MRTLKTTAVFVLLTVIAFGCTDQPVTSPDAVLDAPSANANAAITITDNIITPINLGVFISCADGGAGEVVILTGNLHSLFHITITGNTFTTVVHNQPQGISGNGLSTGDLYHGTGVTRETFGGSFVNNQFSDTFVNNFRIIGQGPGNNFLVHQTFHVTINANGDLTALVNNFSVECR